MAEVDFFADEEQEVEDEVEETVVEPEPEVESAPEDATVRVRLSEDFDAGSSTDENGDCVENERVVTVSVPGHDTVELSDDPTEVDPKHAADLVNVRFAEVVE